jgi:TRAP transporter 4TM/12TM fusion protein
MAQFLAIPYATVVIAAFVPSLLYYIGLLIQADAFAAKQGIKGLPRKEMPSLRQTLKEGWFYLFALFILLWFIFYERVEAQAPFYATAALFPLAMIRKENRITTKIVIDFLYETSRIMVELTAILVSIGLIIGSLMMTGIAHSFSYEIIELAGGNLALLLILGAITSAILGMGVTISACYVILALVLCPALVKAGIYPIAAHLFVLYWGLVSFITPPVAIGAYAAAGLAGSDPMRTAVKSMQFGFVKYLIPFFFVLNPALVLHGPPLEIIYCFITAVVGVTIIGGVLEGYLLWVGKLSLWVRPLLLIGGVLIGIPEWRTDLLGIILVFVSLIAFPGTNFLEKILAKVGFRFKEKKKGD